MEGARAPGWTVVGGPVRLLASTLGLLLRPLNYLVGASPPPRSAQAAAQQFVDGFEREYGERRPDFQVESFSGAVQRAAQDFKFLLVYLHSPLHQDTPDFCRRSLCSDEVLAVVIDGGLVCWGASVCHAEGFRAADSLGASTYPFVALLVCRSAGVDVADRIEGHLGPVELSARITAAVARHSPTLSQMQGQQQAREEAARLRREQDQEYEDALEADRQRQREVEEERLAAERAEEEARQKQEVEQAMEMSRQLAREAELQRKREQVGEEPPKVRPGVEGVVPTVQLRLHLPNGSRVDRRFLISDKLQAVHDYVHVYFGDNSIDIRNYSLSTNYPKRTFQDLEMTLEAAQLTGQAVLFVQDLDA